MSSPTLVRPTSVLRDRVETVLAPAGVGSYVDADGVRRAPARTGTYTGTPTAEGSYVGRDGLRPAPVRGSYVRSAR